MPRITLFWKWVGLAAGVCIAAYIVVLLSETAPPSPQLADEIDRRLALDPCVGAAENWPSRQYVWGETNWSGYGILGKTPIGQNRSVVKVDFYSFTSSNYKPGRQLLRAGQLPWVYDSGDLRFVSATYDVPRRELHINYCGENNPY